jgi:hypothetical protein
MTYRSATDVLVEADRRGMRRSFERASCYGRQVLGT